jgi:hypothetical protein
MRHWIPLGPNASATAASFTRLTSTTYFHRRVQMKNATLQADFNAIRVRSEGSEGALVLDNAQDYIEGLEAKAERLTRMEDVLNGIEAEGGQLAVSFIERFEEFKV